MASLEVEPGLERAVAAALAWRASALLARDPDHGLALLDRAQAEGLGSLSVVVAAAPGRSGGRPTPGAVPLAEHVAGDPDALRLLEGVWLVEPDELRAVRTGIAITREGHGVDADRGELWFAGQAGEAVLLELDSRRRALADEADELHARADGAAREADEALARAIEAEAAYAAVAHLRGLPLDPKLLERIDRVADALGMRRSARSMP